MNVNIKIVVGVLSLLGMQHAVAADDFLKSWWCSQMANKSDTDEELSQYMEHAVAAEDLLEGWYLETSDIGHTDAQFKLGELYEEQGKTLEAEECYRNAILTGNTQAMFKLGDLCAEQGKQDLADFFHYKGAAYQGDINAMPQLAMLCHKNGQIMHAYFWHCKEAAHKGDVIKMFELATRFHYQLFKSNQNKMEHCRQDQAKYWCLKAAAERHKYQMKHWCIEAATKGHVEAMFTLGLLFFQEDNEEETRYWLSKASNEGHKDAKRHLEDLHKK